MNSTIRPLTADEAALHPCRPGHFLTVGLLHPEWIIEGDHILGYPQGVIVDSVAEAASVYRLEFADGSACRRWGQDLLVEIVREQPVQV